MSYIRRTLYDYGSAALVRFEVLIDDANEHHVQGHGVSVAEIEQVFRNEPMIRQNRPDRAAAYVAVGYTDGGSRAFIPFDIVDGQARPITAWRL
ncbi:MAG: hypothetical protein QOI09_1158 [Chloroflexota bacterium]|jgi:uncharacterized DUF497 family protein|nr:hypothetical protein [Chloroflexota bacterium]